MIYKIPVSKPSINILEKKLVSETLKTGWISSQAPIIKEFESAWAEWNQTKYGVACSSGTNALILALRAIGVKEGDEVIVPDFTMIATAWAVSFTGAKPVFVDCKEDLNIDEERIEAKVTSRTKAIIPVHIYGRQCNMDKILELAYEYNLRVIEDSAEAHGIKPRGDIACFSLFANKIISSGEGGICLTNDKFFADQMIHLRGMAFNKDHTFLHRKMAYNFRMPALPAALALAQTKRIDEILAKRRVIEAIYDEGLKDLPSLSLMPKRDVLWMYDVLAVDRRDELRAFLAEQGIETRNFFRPMSEQPMYKDELRTLLSLGWNSTRANWFSQHGLYLPTFTDISRSEQEYVIEKIKEFYGQKK